MDRISDNLKNVISVEDKKLSFTVTLVLSLIVIKVIHLIQIISGLNVLVSIAYFISICLDSLIALYAIIKEKVVLQITIIGNAINLLIWTLIWLAFVICMQFFWQLVTKSDLSSLLDHSVVFIVQFQHMVGNIILILLYVSVGAFILILILMIIRKSLQL